MLSNVIIGGGFALAFMFLGWRWNPRTHGGKVTPSFVARLLVYTSALLLGEVYLMLLIADLRWPSALLFVAIVSWGALLASGVCYRSLRQNRNSDAGQK